MYFRTTEKYFLCGILLFFNIHAAEANSFICIQRILFILFLILENILYRNCRRKE